MNSLPFSPCYPLKKALFRNARYDNGWNEYGNGIIEDIIIV